MAARVEQDGAGSTLPPLEEIDVSDCDIFAALIHEFTGMTMEQKAFLVGLAVKVRIGEITEESLKK